MLRSMACITLIIAGALASTSSSINEATPLTPSVQDTEEVLAIPWRYTRFGWDNASHWAQPAVVDSYDPTVHPAVVAMLMSLAVLFAVLWSSEEADMAPPQTATIPKPWPPDEQGLNPECRRGQMQGHSDRR